jgi:mercuric ion transport protein
VDYFPALSKLRAKAMVSDKLLVFGIIGAVIAALCCFTPLLVILLGAAGLSAIVGILDYIVLPVLAVFLIIVVVALWRRRRT